MTIKRETKYGIRYNGGLLGVVKHSNEDADFCNSNTVNLRTICADEQPWLTDELDSVLKVIAFDIPWFGTGDDAPGQGHLDPKLMEPVKVETVMTIEEVKYDEFLVLDRKDTINTMDCYPECGLGGFSGTAILTKIPKDHTVESLQAYVGKRVYQNYHTYREVTHVLDVKDYPEITKHFKGCSVVIICKSQY